MLQNDDDDKNDENKNKNKNNKRFPELGKIAIVSEIILDSLKNTLDFVQFFFLAISFSRYKVHIALRRTYPTSRGKM